MQSPRHERNTTKGACFARGQLPGRRNSEEQTTTHKQKGKAYVPTRACPRPSEQNVVVESYNFHVYETAPIAFEHSSRVRTQRWTADG